MPSIVYKLEPAKLLTYQKSLMSKTKHLCKPFMLSCKVHKEKESKKFDTF